jgi:hypothetical protein
MRFHNQYQLSAYIAALERVAEAAKELHAEVIPVDNAEARAYWKLSEAFKELNRHTTQGGDK